MTSHAITCLLPEIDITKQYNTPLYDNIISTSQATLHDYTLYIFGKIFLEISVVQK